MIDCTECLEYAHSVLARGEISSDEVHKLALDRHILKGCESLSTQVVFFDSSKIPMNIVCNGFNMKDVIFEVLMKKDKRMVWDNDDLLDIAEAITDAFAVKLRLKQGDG